MQLDARIPPGPLAQKWDNRRFSARLVNPANRRKYRVLVVGSGLAGASAAAMAASPNGLPASAAGMPRYS